ncbi:MAG: hypothetical protein HWN65_02720 [Candidatus Helarchaeota archaeon]|nr:hypothetical protein [Candidatus Helarchaeota archaeon]
MAIQKEIKEYALLHYKTGKTAVHLFFKDGSKETYADLDPARALLVVDILRNEKPVYWTAGPDILSTGKEPVGEEES